MTARLWFRGLLLGAASGVLVLGVGGRLAMRGVAIVQEWTLSFSVEGSLTVVTMGTLAGVGGALILLVITSVPRLPGVARAALFWIAAWAITLRILQPLEGDRLVMFTPVLVAYVLVMQLGVRRLRRYEPGPHARISPPVFAADDAEPTLIQPPATSN